VLSTCRTVLLAGGDDVYLPLHLIFFHQRTSRHCAVQLWAPPTPPQDDSDLYIDATQSFVYESSVMSENQLPAVYVRKGHKRHRVDSYSMLYTIFYTFYCLSAALSTVLNSSDVCSYCKQVTGLISHLNTCLITVSTVRH